jgi:hypothetical protein
MDVPHCLYDEELSHTILMGKGAGTLLTYSIKQEEKP